MNIITSISGGAGVPECPIAPPPPTHRPKRGLLWWRSLGVGGAGRWKSNGHHLQQQQQQQEELPGAFSMKKMGTTAYITTEKSASQERFLAMDGQDLQQHQLSQRRRTLGASSEGLAAYEIGVGLGGHNVDDDDEENISIKTNSGLGAKVSHTISRKVSTLKWNTGVSGSNSSSASPNPNNSNNINNNNNHNHKVDTPSRANGASAIHQAAEGGIQKSVEISISEEPVATATTLARGELDSLPIMAHTITRAYNTNNNVPGEPNPIHAHHTRPGRPGETWLY